MDSPQKAGKARKCSNHGSAKKRRSLCNKAAERRWKEPKKHGEDSGVERTQQVDCRERQEVRGRGVLRHEPVEQRPESQSANESEHRAPIPFPV